MKKLIRICTYVAAALCVFDNLDVRAQVVTHYNQSEPMYMWMPLVTDSLDITGGKYEAAALLGERVAWDKKKSGATIIEADTSGYVTIGLPNEGYALNVLEWRMRPVRYVKGEIKVTGNAMFEVLVDGISKVKKDEIQDTVSDASSKSVKITMNPQTEHIVTIKLLTDAKSENPVSLKAEFIADKDFADVPVSICVDGKRRFEVRDLTLGKRVSNVSISADGRYMKTSYRERLSKDDNIYSATLTDLRTGKVINQNLPTSLAWMPKGSRMYRTVQGRNGYDVYVVDIPTMEETLFASDLPVKDFNWSPNEEFVVYYQNSEPAPAPNGPRRYLDPDDRIPGNSNRTVAKIYDLKTGVSRTMTHGNRQAYITDISRDSNRMLLQVANYDATEWPFYFTDLYEVDINTMKADTLLKHESALQSAMYSPDGREILLIAGPRSFGNIGLNAGTHPIANDSDMQAFIMDLSTGDIRPMTKYFNPSISSKLKWNVADNKIYFLAENGFNNTLYIMDPKNGDIKQMPQGVTYVQNFSVGDEDARYIAYFGQSYDASGQAYVIDQKKGDNTLVANPWSQVSDEIEWGELRPYNFRTADGTEIEGFMTLPPNFDPTKKYPMIVYYYGGTAPTQHNTYSQYNAQLFASRGYVVYQLNPSGTTGYGQEFSARHVNAWGDMTADEIIEGVKRICADNDFIDSEKIGCIGASYGGFMTEYLQTLTDIFAAAVSHAGISNVTSYWGEGYWGYSYNALAAANSYPWNNPDLFTRHGALFNADKIHTPLLMTHGTGDTNVPVGESIQLFNALKILGREAELVTFEGEDHYISDYDNIIRWQNTVMAWMAKWLQNDSKWWDELYPRPAFTGSR